MGLSSATQRNPMISVQNRCETSRFRTLRTMWLMPRGGKACGGTGATSLATVPSMYLPERYEHCTAPGIRAPGRLSARPSPGALQVARRPEQAPVDVQPLQGLGVELAGHRELFGELIPFQRRPHPGTEDPVDRPGMIAKVAQHALSLSNERRPLRLGIPRGSASDTRAPRVRPVLWVEIAAAGHGDQPRAPNR